jgi:hypothetical protein
MTALCASKHSQLLLEAALQPPLHGIEVLVGGDPRAPVLLSTSQRKVLGHDAINVDSVDTGLLELLGEGDELGSAVELTALGQTLCPGVDGSNGVGRCLVALLVLAEVAGDGAVGGLGLERLAVGGDENRGHETEGAEALGDNVGLDVTVVVCSVLVEIQRYKYES